MYMVPVTYGPFFDGLFDIPKHDNKRMKTLVFPAFSLGRGLVYVFWHCAHAQHAIVCTHHLHNGLILVTPLVCKECCLIRILLTTIVFLYVFRFAVHTGLPFPVHTGLPFLHAALQFKMCAESLVYFIHVFVPYDINRYGVL